MINSCSRNPERLTVQEYVVNLNAKERIARYKKLWEAGKNVSTAARRKTAEGIIESSDGFRRLAMTQIMSTPAAGNVTLQLNHSHCQSSSKSTRYPSTVKNGRCGWCGKEKLPREKFCDDCYILHAKI